MGQDTYADIGATVNIDLTLANLPMICQLLGDAKIDCYVQHGDEADEIFEINTHLVDAGEIESGGIIPYLSTIQTEEQLTELTTRLFSGGDPQDPDDQPQLHFLIKVTKAEAHNISRRKNPSILGPFFENDAETVEDVMTKFKEAQSTFMWYGIDPKEIKVGYTFTDSY